MVLMHKEERLCVLGMMLCLLVCLASVSSATKEEDATTTTTCSNTKQPPMRSPLTFCDDYRSSSCCTPQDTDKMLVHHVEMQRQSVSARCAALYSRFECSKCDARNGGNGLVERSTKSSKGSTSSSSNARNTFKVCSGYAKQLYKACKEEYFVEGGSGTNALTPCKSTDAICAKLEEFSEEWDEAVKLMGAEVVARKKKSSTDDDDEEEDDDDEEGGDEDEEGDDKNRSNTVNDWCFDGSVPEKVFEKKPKPNQKTSQRHPDTKSTFSRLKKFRWRKYLTKRYWQRERRLVKLLAVIYAFFAVMLLYKKNATKIKMFFWKRRVENLRQNLANAAEMRMKSS